MEIKEYEMILAVHLREELRIYSGITEEPFMTLIIEYKNPKTGEITLIREPK